MPEADRQPLPPEIFTQIIGMHPALLRLIQSMGVPCHDAEDLAQEAMIAVLCSSYREEGLGVWPYLRTTARNKVCRSRRRKAITLEPTEHDVLDAIAVRSGAEFDVEGVVNAVLREHEDHPDHKIWEARTQGRTLSEVARQFGLSIEWARVRSHRHALRIQASILERTSWAAA